VSGWQHARIADIPATNPVEWWDEWARDKGRYGARWHSIREALGITSFGVNAYEADAGEELVVPHDERDFGGQEELYVLVRGRARFVLDGEDLELGALEVLRVDAEVTREARALEDGTVVLMVGGIPGKPYAAGEEL
jgi:uncharacterized cupin superfamily protein